MTQPLPIRKRFVPKPLPESKFYHPRETETCPHCKQPIHSPKFSRREKVDALENNTQNIGGYVIIRMADAIQHHLPTAAVATLLAQVQRTIDWQRGVCPSWICSKYPRLAWFKQAISVESTDGSRIHEQILSLIEERKAS